MNDCHLARLMFAPWNITKNTLILIILSPEGVILLKFPQKKDIRLNSYNKHTHILKQMQNKNTNIHRQNCHAPDFYGDFIRGG